MLHELIIFLLIYINEKTYKNVENILTAAHVQCTFVPCTFVPYCIKFKFVTEKILKTGVDLPANQWRQTFLVAKVKRTKIHQFIFTTG